MELLVPPAVSLKGICASLPSFLLTLLELGIRATVERLVLGAAKPMLVVLLWALKAVRGL